MRRLKPVNTGSLKHATKMLKNKTLLEQKIELFDTEGYCIWQIKS